MKQTEIELNKLKEMLKSAKWGQEYHKQHLIEEDLKVEMYEKKIKEQEKQLEEEVKNENM